MTKRWKLAIAGLFAAAFALGFTAPARADIAAAVPAPVVAQADPVATPADSNDYVMNEDLTIDVNPTQLLFITGLVLPVIVGLVTKYGASSKLKALVNLVAAGIASFLANAVTEGGHAVFALAQLQDWILVFAISTVTYLGLAKPVDTKLTRLAPNAGLGTTT